MERVSGVTTPMIVVGDVQLIMPQVTGGAIRLVEPVMVISPQAQLDGVTLKLATIGRPAATPPGKAIFTKVVPAEPGSVVIEHDPQLLPLVKLPEYNNPLGNT